MNIQVTGYSKTLVTICHSQRVTSQKSMTFKDDITIVIKSQQYHDYHHLKSHVMSTTKSREIVFVWVIDMDYSREPPVFAFYLNYFRWHTPVRELALVDQTAAKCTCGCGKRNVS
jgi:hypothetical protein